MKRFIDSILAGNFDIENLEGKTVNGTKADFLPSLREAVLMNITNVYDWFTKQNENNSIIFKDVAPLAKMPFNVIWCEWTEQSIVEDEGTINYGVLCIENPSNDRDIQALFFTSCTSTPKAFCNVTASIELNENYSVSSIQVFIPKNMVEENFKNDREAATNFFDGLFCVACCAFSFCNCSNVQVLYARPTKSEMRKERKTKILHNPMGFIEIHRNMVRRKYEHEIGTGISSIVPHIVRGHFKRYSADKKLFGTVEGVWFWGAHARGGKAEAKDYRVSGPNEAHKDDCIVNDGEGK
jgi:hypothetical protein